MKKSIEIEVPDGKVEEISKDGDTISIKFVSADICERVKTFVNVIEIARKLYPDIYNKWWNSNNDSYEEKLYAYRMIVAVLTNNEKNHLTTGERYFPSVQFCEPDKVNSCSGDAVIGHIKSEGRRFVVVGGSVCSGSSAGLGCFYSAYGVSASNTAISFRSVSSKKVAEHISKYFGRLVFDLIYAESNCDYEWID